jgi:predicted DNA binding CopG/RHH family protein
LGETLDGRLAFVVFRQSDHRSGGPERTAAVSPQVGGAMKGKKKLSPAKSPLPKMQSDEEVAEYFERHSVAGVWDRLPEARQAKPAPALASKIRDRHGSAKSPISLRLAPEQIAAAKHIAAAKSVGYQTQLRMWIVEGIRREAKRT